MYKALNYWVYGGFSGVKTPYEFIDYAAEKGLDGVELTVGDALQITQTEAECRQIREYAAKKRIGLRSLATGYYWGCNLGSPDPAERQQGIEFSTRYLQLGAWLGCEAVLAIPGVTRVVWDPSRPVVSYKTVWENATGSLRQLEPVARKFGVVLALENVWNRFLISPMEWKIFLDQFDPAAVGMYFDTGNCCFAGRPVDYIELVGSRIKAVHLKNFIESDCGGGLHGFGDDLLQGVVDFAAVFSALKKVGYSGPTTVEMVPFSRGDDMVLPDQELADKMVAQLKTF